VAPIHLFDNWQVDVYLQKREMKEERYATVDKAGYGAYSVYFLASGYLFQNERISGY
jgi:hypothetical protein